MVIIDIESNTSVGGLTLDPAGMHCPSGDDAFVSSVCSTVGQSFDICGNGIEAVKSWPHLGHIISSDVIQANNFICAFGKLDCSVKTKLLKSFCSNFYSCEPWDLNNVNIDMLCTSWRQAVRRLWNLPYNCHTTILEVLSECIPLFDVFCKRSANFINRCLVSDNVIVSFVAHHGIHHSRMLSFIGRNFQFRCDLRMYDLVNSTCCDSIIDKVSADRLDLSVYCC